MPRNRLFASRRGPRKRTKHRQAVRLAVARWSRSTELATGIIRTGLRLPHRTNSKDGAGSVVPREARESCVQEQLSQHVIGNGALDAEVPSRSTNSSSAIGRPNR